MPAGAADEVAPQATTFVPSPLTPAVPLPWWRHPRLVVLAGPLLVLAPLARADAWGAEARALLIGGTALACWLTEWTPAWLPTLLLWLGVPALFAGLGADWGPATVLGWSADPVLLLFTGGFALAAAARAQGVDRRIAAAALRLAHGDAWRLVVTSAVATWVLSMWMSNIAAAALMLAAVAPVLDVLEARSPLRRALLVAIAMAANTGGIATPIGTGPNAIAIAAAAPVHRIAFVEWMAFGVPLAAGLLGGVLVVLWWWVHRQTGGARVPVPVLVPDAGAVTRAVGPAPSGTHAIAHEGRHEASRTVHGDEARGMDRASRPHAGRVAAIGGMAIVAWLTEPLHGVPAWQVATALVGVLLVSGALPWRDVVRLDWATLLLIAGGLALGGLLESAGLIRHVGRLLSLEALAPGARVALLVLVAALGSALMSNTATATILVPLAWAVAPAPSTAVLVAIGCSLGVPFVISTPPNAMAVARGLPSSALLVVGVPVLLVGSAVVAWTGPWVLGWVVGGR